jgi:ADP-ribosylglycohydrolase
MQETTVFALQDYRDKVLGCWMGKNIGGTLGAPFEWKRQINDVTFYTQELNGEPLPNDDLDLQLLWLVALEAQGIDLDARMLGHYWLHYITPHWNEYGNSKANMRAGLMPPLSGSANNSYKHSCGAYIRSEIWACIAPGAPQVAARYAYEDAAVDHGGDGEGTYAEVFCAALESAAFVENDPYKLIQIGLSYIPSECEVAAAVTTAHACFESGKTWLEARDEVLKKHRGHYVVNNGISQRDFDKGLADGPIGYDVPSNIAIVVIGWLYGAGDFEKSLCIAVNCGEDTDCTAATLGSILGITQGMKNIPQKWIDPIGRGIKTMCLNNGDLGRTAIPGTIDELTARVEQIAKQVVLRYCLSVELSETKSTSFPLVAYDRLAAGEHREYLYRNTSGPIYAFDLCEVRVAYIGDPYVKDGEEARIELTIQNKLRIQQNINVRWYFPEGWMVGPSASGKLFLQPSYMGLELSTVRTAFTLSNDRSVDSENRFVIELTVDGSHAAMLVPVILLNGNLVD